MSLISGGFPFGAQRAAHVRDLEPCRGRLSVHALAADGDVTGDDRRHYGHLAADAEEYERGLLDA
jgi:hypothetical protein